MNEQHPGTARRLKQIEALLSTEPMTARELAEAAHMTNNTAIRYMKYLRKSENKRVYVSAWTLVGQHVRTAVYSWGSEKDKRRPRPQSNAVGRRAYRERHSLPKGKSTWLTPLGAV